MKIETLHLVVCMKPLEGTFAQNALEQGVAGFNVDACRVYVSSQDAKFMERCNTKGSWRFKAIRSEDGAMGRSKPSENLDTTRGRYPTLV